MHLNRRQLLSIAGLSLVSGVGVSKLWFGRSQLQAQPPVDMPPFLAQAATKLPLLRFVAIADTGSGDANQYDVAAAINRYRQQNPFSLVVLAGDNIYNNGEIEKIGSVFEQPYASLLEAGVRFQACLGNHDLRTANGELQVQYANFHMRGHYYTFQESSVQFFALETYGSSDWSAQLAWLEQALRTSKAPWKIVYGHHPIYSSGRYGSDSNLIQTLTPLFKRYGVQLYINGHEHDYERTRSIDGTTYLVTGIGGAHLRPVGQSEWTEFSGSRYGFSALEVYADRLEIQGIGTDGQVFDRGTVALQSAMATK